MVTVLPIGVVQVDHPSASRVTAKPPPSLARWWCLHSVARLSAEVAPRGKGTVWSISHRDAGCRHPGAVHIASLASR